MRLSEMLMQCFIKVDIFSKVMFLFKLKSLGENRQTNGNMKTSILVIKKRSLKWEWRKHVKEYGLKINLKKKNS